MTNVPTPPWRKQRRQIKPQLSQELIVETGLRIVDAEGIDALSMRRIAQELDTGPASLYAHVSNKEELVELIYDLVLSEIRLPEKVDSWQEGLRDYALEAHRVLTAHADLAKAALANIPTGPNALRVGEAMLGLMIEAGLSPRDAALALDRISLYISSDAYEESLHYARMRASGHEDPVEYIVSFIDQITVYYKSLPSDQFPYTSKYANVLTADDGAVRFLYGLDLMIAGLEARMP
ncbi:TetR/AcrR family transcriptional regulator C-terminal domain-containing protein [Nonomuraea sediminis]|uniref:TetR/AcrR family transcriptional regulator C-terminal domain-containing protein n=1 Tax=Nonomuraea sediminis TaxID=2835864 RepID=UPI001BDD8718|nr:TetR/AcrR family transcriptional regulator C-terminal domain-containing protein [Nonomuraea sediminis]